MTKIDIIEEGASRLVHNIPAINGWVIEAIIETKLAWLIEPRPHEYYTFTFDLEKAYVFDKEHVASTIKDCVHCGLETKGMIPNLELVYVNDKYRASVANDKTI